MGNDLIPLDIDLERGVLQGCPASPILANMLMEVLLSSIDPNLGVLFHGEMISKLSYADDVALVAPNPTAMIEQLRRIGAASKILGLSFNPAKCSSLTCIPGAATLSTMHSEEQVFEIYCRDKGKTLPIPILKKHETYRYLGCPTTLSERLSEESDMTIKNIYDDLVAIDSSALKPAQKLDAVRRFSLPILNFVLRERFFSIKSLDRLNKDIRWYIGKWLSIGNSCLSDALHLPTRYGGTGIPDCIDRYQSMSITHCLRLMNNQDKMIQSLALAVFKKDLGVDDLESLVRKLNSDEPGSGFLGKTVIMRALQATRSMKKSYRVFEIRWILNPPSVYGDQDCLIGLEIKDPNGRGYCVNGKGSFKVLTNAFLRTKLRNVGSRSTTVNCMTDTWHDQKSSNSWIKDGKDLDTWAYRYAFAARMGVHKLAGRKYKLKMAAAAAEDEECECRYCPGMPETMGHIQGWCKTHSALRQERHKRILDRIRNATSLLQERHEVRFEQQVWDLLPQNHRLGSLKPDILIITRSGNVREIKIIDMGIMTPGSLSLQHQRHEKAMNYRNLQFALQNNGWTVNINDVFALGSNGSTLASNETLAAEHLMISRSFYRKMIRFMIADVLWMSSRIYYRHLCPMLCLSRDFLEASVPPDNGDRYKGNPEGHYYGGYYIRWKLMTKQQIIGQQIKLDPEDAIYSAMNYDPLKFF